MSSATLVRYGGLAAILAGVLRTGVSFIPYSANPGAALELLYLVIDILILLGLLGVYGYEHEEVGWCGFLGFLPALIGTAIITGPDGAIGGVSMYILGSLLISAGLSLLSIASWRANRLPRLVPVLWLLSTAVGVGGFLIGGPAITYMMAGIFFGLAFIGAGVRIWVHKLPPNPDRSRL